MAGALVALVLVGWLAATAVLWWDGGAVASLRAERARLAEEVGAMRANREEWARSGMLSQLRRCGPQLRPCVRVDKAAPAFGTEADYRVLRGY